MAFLGIRDSPDRRKIRRTKRLNYPFRVELPEGPESFQFAVLADSGDGRPPFNPQYAVAQRLALDYDQFDFVAHAGDVVYQIGSRRYYGPNFLQPYARFIANPDLDNLVFNKPFLVVPGNHDYYDLSRVALIRRIPVFGTGAEWLATRFAGNLGEGSHDGRVFEGIFIDDPGGAGSGIPSMPYECGRRTRLPNRYYTFRYGCASFFALDSNTLDAPKSRGDRLSRLKRHRFRRAMKQTDSEIQRLSEWIEACRVDIEDGRLPVAEVEEEMETRTQYLLDLLYERAQYEHALAADEDGRDHDADQIAWLREQLRMAPKDDWKILILHHPLYTFVKTYCESPDVVGVRENIRRVLIEEGVHLVLAAHSHSFEWVRALNEKESRIAYLTAGSGGSRWIRPSILHATQRRPDVADYRERARACTRLARSEAFAGLDPTGRARTFNYLHVHVSPEKIRIVPVGIYWTRTQYGPEHPMIVEHQDPARGHPFRTVRRKLEAVEVFRDRPPEGRWSD